MQLAFLDSRKSTGTATARTGGRQDDARTTDGGRRREGRPGRPGRPGTDHDDGTTGDDQHQACTVMDSCYRKVAKVAKVARVGGTESRESRESR